MTKILVDNTVLSNFSLINHLNLLATSFQSLGTTAEVVSEYEVGIEKGILPATKLDWLDTYRMTQAEKPLFNSLMNRVNKGEASCLAIAVNRNYRFLTDDRDARKIAAQLQVSISGTIGVLAHLVTTKELAVVEADLLLTAMIDSGYRSPISSLLELTL